MGASARINCRRSSVHARADREKRVRELAGISLSLMITNPSITWAFNYSVDPKEFVFESAPIVKDLESLSLTEPTVLAYL